MEKKSKAIPPLLVNNNEFQYERRETVLNGHDIACFKIGGESRLCFPQIIHTVLSDFTLEQINSICDDLQIFLCQCNDSQLYVLRKAHILPLNTPSCGLIKKTDAERLCHELIYRKTQQSVGLNSPQKYDFCRDAFQVYHECFGRCTGIFNPTSYVSPDSECITCIKCGATYSPPVFTCHSHEPLEKRTCHWGFDSAKWRSYLMLAKSQSISGDLQSSLDKVKALFDDSRTVKKRQHMRVKSLDKRMKLDDARTQNNHGQKKSIKEESAFRPWSETFRLVKDVPAYLHIGQPVLLNPESVVYHSDTSKYERNFAPNVSLMPVLPEKDKEKHSSFKQSPPTTVAVPSSGHLIAKTINEITVNSETTLEQELSLVQKIMSCVDARQKEKLFHEFSVLRARSEVRMTRVVQDLKTLQQETMILIKEKNDLAMAHKQTLQELKREHERIEKSFRDDQQHRERLVMEIDELHKKLEKSNRAKETLKSEDENYTQTNYEALKRKVIKYQRELERHEKDGAESLEKKVSDGASTSSSGSSPLSPHHYALTPKKRPLSVQICNPHINGHAPLSSEVSH